MLLFIVAVPRLSLINYLIDFLLNINIRAEAHLPSLVKLFSLTLDYISVEINFILTYTFNLKIN